MHEKGRKMMDTPIINKLMSPQDEIVVGFRMN